MSEEQIQFFQKQKRIYPKRVWGKFRKLKWLVMILTLSIYYLAPWIRWDRGEAAPDQAILIDMVHSKAYFFFIEIWPQEVYYITGILIFAAIALFFVTSLFGRIWCGYSCPQTVWTDLFVWVERIFQGDRISRMRLDEAPLSFNKIWRKGATHLTWLLIGLCTGGAWVFYFNDAPTLFEQIIHFDIPWSVGSWIIALTFSTYLMAGFAREQVCTYMCPYARFQSAMFDKDSLIISYDKERGEPRGSHKKGESWENRGDCIDCTACVQVCPTGIDIRNGLQMECIACGLCVDACNNIMDKIERPRNLIRYSTENNMKTENKSFKFLRPRTIYYVLLLTIVASIMLYGLVNRSNVELHVLHDRNPLFVKLSDGSIRNGYDIKILNKTHQDRSYKLEVEGLDNYEIKMQGVGNLNTRSLIVFANSTAHFRVFITSKDVSGHRKNINFKIYDRFSNAFTDYDSVFISGRNQ